MKVVSNSGGRSTHNKVTAITLKGDWLADAGFETGRPLKVRMMPG
ncbi:SymE family type I addiction module toxin (plasmid) [Pantoea allii]